MANKENKRKRNKSLLHSSRSSPIMAIQVNVTCHKGQMSHVTKVKMSRTHRPKPVTVFACWLQTILPKHKHIHSTHSLTHSLTLTPTHHTHTHTHRHMHTHRQTDRQTDTHTHTHTHTRTHKDTHTHTILNSSKISS